ncbi:hypothetical protein [Nocardia altamirensis]|uniref:hypothetical protein n=1 Tax=Nocardia altamirensis TaxID=472158 RepID=UPI0008409055|nr:hypothetical protein [Nocardia altamirensis]
MRHQLAFSLGVTALVASAVAVLAPQAAAQELAPGLNCDRFVCRNDTDDTYRVEALVSCSDWGDRRITHEVPVVRKIRPRTTLDVTPSCNAPGETSSHALWIDYRGAWVDNRPATGSAG